MTAQARLELMTEEEAAAYLGVSPKTLRGMRKRGEIAYIRITSKLIRYSQKLLDEYVESTAIIEPRPMRAIPALDGKMTMRPCVYFVRSGEHGPIKIGYAKFLRKRLHALSTAHHEKLILLATLAGGEVQEKRLHKQFAAYRLRGEWFEPAEELLRYIETIREPFA